MYGMPAAVLAMVVPAALAVSPVTAPPTPGDRPTETVGFEIVTLNGSACPSGSVTAQVASDNSAFVVDYDTFRAMLGPDASRFDARKTCQVVVMLTPPAGWTYAISGIELAGSLQLAKGASARVKTSFQTSGGVPAESTQGTFAGPFDGAWNWTHPVDVAALVYYPCRETRYINLGTELRLDYGTSSRSATSTIAFLPPDRTTPDRTTPDRATPGGAPPGGAKRAAVYHLTWVACPG